MRVTGRLYFENAYQRDFTARVEEQFAYQGRNAAVLDRTCFYPESGGQPADRGKLDEAGVVHVFEDGERIVHLLDRKLGRAEVRGSIDWERRFDHMQQHTGQHILSQCFIEIIEGETRSFHLGERASTLEIGAGAISDADLERVEARANEVVFEDREVKTYFVKGEEAGKVPFRRPPQKEGTIRVVEVEGFDFSACGGTHCRRTGEVGMVKIVRWDKIRGNLRFEFLCGGRARLDYARKNRNLLEISGRLSVGEDDAAAAVQKATRESKELRKRQRQLQEVLASYQAEEMIRTVEGPLVKASWTDRTADEAKLLALRIIRMADRVVLFAVQGEARGHLIFACSQKLELDMRELVPLVAAKAPVKGGGSATLAEVVVEKGISLDPLLMSAEAFLRERLKSRAGE